ncbi:conserved hypothetical protein [Leishmania major strain Friedlin]|uniref:Uncharacterized protein n=1 Tax=Leishmania major TaxID=5664 RepID=Q4Q4L4_LEIMA|nr:conserved hypothetical protein [Leishmania major strain Friedlin]CAG9580559.1 hypothetical_protein_-_conserved [Leishmania major strain Friedlin]CAJ05841.1 conserved hypothetical protein [Leishmania major strain Friedlin]|eukprot:XP_001685734.1 conserved hypothetical protein [Leishmania major strain Friedlin]
MPLAQRTEWRPRPTVPIEHNSTLSTGCQPAAITDVFFSCCASPLCQESALLSIFKQLSADQQCDILSMILTSATSFSKPQLASYVEEALQNDSFLPVHWVRLATNLPGISHVPPLPWVRITERVLCSSAAPFSSRDDAWTFIARVLGCMEDGGIPRDTIAQCLERCGLFYEACAYASSSSNFVPPPTRLVPDGGWGYGDVIHSMCALPEPPMRWFSATRSGMPPVLRRYSTLVLLRSVVRKWGVTDNGHNDRWRTFAEAYMTTLEAASAVHFLFGEGNAVTGRFLLPHCHTQQQIATVIRYTCRVGVALALAGLTRSVELLTAHRSLAHVHLTHRRTGQKAHWLFWAQAERSSAALSSCDVSDSTAVALFSPTFFFGIHDRGVLRRCLREVLATGALAKGDRSLARLFSAIPVSAVEHAVKLLGTVESDALSWWASLYTEAGNFEGAFAVLEATAARGCLPHMGVLVMLLEALRDDRQNFLRAVALLRSSFSQVSETVLRAFVERTAAGITHTTPLALSTRQAMQALNTLDLMSAAHRPATTPDATTDDASSTTAPLLAFAEVADSLKMPIPLHVGAIEGLIAASLKLDYDVSLTVDVVSASGECCWSWTSTPE